MKHKHKHKKTYSRYQVAGQNLPDVQPPTAQMNQFSGVNPANKDILAFLLSPQGEQFIAQYKKEGYIPKANDNEVSVTRETGYRDFSPGFKVFNTAALLATGIANQVKEVKNRRDEFKQYLRSIQPTSYENFDEQGLNPNPIYTKYGGKIYQAGGMERAANSHGRCRINDAMCREDKINERLARKGKPLIEDKTTPWEFITSPNSYSKAEQKQIQQEYNSRLATLPAGTTLDQYTAARRDSARVNPNLLRPDYNKYFNEQGLLKPEYENIKGNFDPQLLFYRQQRPASTEKMTVNDILNMFSTTPDAYKNTVNSGYKMKSGGKITGYSVAWAKNGKWIPHNLHKGRCAHPGSPECPKGSPQYNLAMTFKKHHGFHKDGGCAECDKEAEMYPYGGGPLTAEGAKEILRDGTVHGKKLTPKQRRYFGYIAGGGKPKHQLGGDEEFNEHDTPTIEAEEGEVIQTPQGTIDKVPEGSGTHEEGGVLVDNAEKVLEDTSDKRKDFASRLLKLSPDTAEFLTGVRPKGHVTHSKALEIASAQYGKQVLKLQDRIKRSLKTLDRNKTDKYASNSIDLNLQALSKIPESEDTFNNLFDHQETLKGIAGIEAARALYGKMNKYQVKKGQAYAMAQTGIENAPRLHDTTGWEYLYRKGTRNYYKKPDGKIVASEGPKMSNADWVKFLQTETPEHKAARQARLQGRDKYGYTEPIAEIDPYTHTPPIRDITVAPHPDFPDMSEEETATVPRQQFNLLDQPKSQFNEPLRWFDVAGPIDAYLSSGRIPAKYNPRELHQIRLQQQNPLPALQEGQRNYNEALKSLQANGQGYSNLSDLFSKKYGVDTSVLGQYENINKGIKNQEIMYNSQIRDQQSLADQQAREVFEQKYLGSIEAQRQQRLTALDDLYQRIAQNRKLNREGNLLMQLFPAFDQYAQRNSYRYQFRNPIGFPQGTTGNLNAQQILQAKQILSQARKEGRVV